MDLNVAQRAEVLVKALPYIQRYSGRVVVVKYGGNAMIDPELTRAVMSDVVLLTQVGVRVVLVHGGGPEITDLLGRLNIESRFIDGLRATDGPTMEVVQMVLAGKINKDLVALAGTTGGKALGLCGMDAGMIRARPIRDELGFAGEVEAVDPSPVAMALGQGYIPIVASVGADAAGNAMNVNADTAAAAIAGELGAENVIVMTDILGLMRDPGDPSSLIPSVRIDEVQGLIDGGVVKGGMIPKVRCMVDAVRRGAKRAVMIDGRIPHAILIEMFSDEGIGTLFTV